MNQKSLLFALSSISFVALGLFTSEAQAEGRTCFTLTKDSLGGIKLGMTRAELNALKLAPAPARLGPPKQFPRKALPGELEVGTFMVRMDGPNGTVSNIRLDDDEACVRWKGTRIALAASGPRIAAQLGVCGPVSHNIGGNGIACAGGAISLAFKEMGGSSYRTLTVKTVAPSAEAPLASCEAYLEPGYLLADKKKQWPLGAALDVLRGKTYCVGGKRFDSTLEPDAIPALGFNTCSKLSVGGGLVVHCDFQGARFHFAGGQLTKLQLVAVKAPHSGPLPGVSLR
jgi:hypothetical protein